MTDLYKLKKAPEGSPKKWQIKVATPAGGVKTVQFGARGYEDYTQHKDKSRRDNYRSRHRKDKINDPTKAGFWSWHVLWGDSTDIKKNLASAKKKYRLNPSEASMKKTNVDIVDVPVEKLEEKRRGYYEKEHYSNPVDYTIYLEEEPELGGFVWKVALGDFVLEEGWSSSKELAQKTALSYVETADERACETAIDIESMEGFAEEDYLRGNPEWARDLGRAAHKAGVKAREYGSRAKEYAEESYQDFREGYREARGNPAKRFPRSTVIQSLVFDKDFFTKSQAKRWAAQHDFVLTGVDTKENTYRIRQHEPSSFTQGTFRTIELSEGVQAVVGMPKKGISL